MKKIIIVLSLFCFTYSFSQTSKRKTLKEIYEESRKREGKVIIPPQVNFRFLKKLKEMSKKKNIRKLLIEYKKYKKISIKKRGEWIRGNMILGSPEKYYQPSEEEKRLSLVGMEIKKLIKGLSKRVQIRKAVNALIQLKNPPLEINFKYYSFYHVDVVGSGRFIYPNLPVSIHLNIPGILVKKIIQYFHRSRFYNKKIYYFFKKMILND